MKCGEAMVKKTMRTTRAASARTRCTASDFTIDRSLTDDALHRSSLVSSPAATDSRCVASVMIRSWSASAAVSSPVSRPSHMTMMRWLMRRISGSSEEIMMIDLPSAASSLSRW